MQFGEFLGDRNNPVARLVCPECGEEVFVKGTMTFQPHRSVLEFEDADHEHEIFFEKRVVTEF